MPDQHKGGDQSGRFEKLTKSVLETDHPVFGKIKKELPQFNNRQVSVHPWLDFLKNWSRDRRVASKGLIAICSILISFFIYRQITDPFLDYKLGDMAQRHLVAQRTMEMVDEETTDAKRKSSLEGVLSVYDYDRHIFYSTTDKIHRAFQIVRKDHEAALDLVNKRVSSADMARTDSFIQAKKAFSTALDMELSDGQFESILRLQYSKKVERILIHLLSKENLNLIVADKEFLKSDQSKGITLSRLSEGSEAHSEQTFTNISSIVDLEAARQDIAEESKAFFTGPLAVHAGNIVQIAKRLVIPNLTLNRQETEKRKKEVLDDIKPVLVKINKGEPIVRYGETINKRHLAILKQLEKNSESDNTRFQFVFTAIFLFIVMASVTGFLEGGLKPFHYHPRDLLVFTVLMVVAILGIKAMQFIAVEALIEKFPQIPFDFYYFLVPVAAGPVIIRMIAVKEPSLVFTLVLSVVGGILLERNFFYSCYVLASCLTATSLAQRIKTRGVIYRAGLITGVVNVLLITCIVANTRNAGSLSRLWDDMHWIFWSGMISGFTMSMIVVSVVPLVEMISGRTSDLRLLELANMNHPLLRDLMVKAPGTYHHSIVIGSLVEAAAEAINANPLLARVMAYYHDVGKMERPLYFIENQGGGYNRHDSLQPHMSAMIIREHVKKGEELGRKFKLPQPIIAAMSEHHGSSTIWYFYNKARSQTEEPDSVLESDYKYDGHKPQSKETALVMLGDVVEAATRSVADPTPLRLSGVVKNILNKYFAEGQLSECDLTLRDLDLIAKSFMDVLLGIYHARIEYGVSSIRDGGKRKNGNQDSKTSPKLQAGSPVAGAGSTSSLTKAIPIAGAGGTGSKKS